MPKFVIFFNLFLVHQLFIYTLLCFHPKAFTYNQNINFENKGHHRDIFPKTLIIKKILLSKLCLSFSCFNIHAKTTLDTCNPSSSFQHKIKEFTKKLLYVEDLHLGWYVHFILGKKNQQTYITTKTSLDDLKI
jgi:hypothetical protein